MTRHRSWLLAAFLLLPSCVQPTNLYLQADGARYDALAPEHARYVRADTTLDPMAVQRRWDLLAAWKKALLSGGIVPTAAVPEVDAIVPTPTTGEAR